MISIDNYDFKNKKVLLRVDFNVPIIGNWEEYDFTRIKLSVPIILKILTDGGSVILLSHWGQPLGKVEESRSFKKILPHIERILNVKKIFFCENPFDRKTAETAKKLKSGEILLLENLRFFPEEITENEEFAQLLASFGNCYVNDAFGASHRVHTSTVTLPKYFPYDKMLGYSFEKEITKLDNLIIDNNKVPFTLLIGGNKISSKIGVIEALITKIDNLLIGGALAFPFLAVYGNKTGNITIEKKHIETAKRIMNLANKHNVKIHLPIDFVISDVISEDGSISHCEKSEIPNGWSALDIGIKTIENFVDVISNSKTLLWDGPMGMYEIPNFSYGTLKIALSIGRLTDKGLFSVVGGGDTIAALNKYSISHKMSYISSAGGALLEYLEKNSLPAIEAIKKSFDIDSYDFKNKKAIIRVDFNVPLDENFNVVDDTRIITASPSIRKILTDGGSVILITHLGRPKGKYDEKLSVKHIVSHLSQRLGQEVKFSGEIIGKNTTKMAKELKPGEIMILENVRFDPRETENNEEFAKELAQLGDVYIMNAFGTAHRAHASTYNIAKFFPKDKMLGYLVESEINSINKILQRAEKPFTAIIGGSKISTKINIIKALIKKVDCLIIGGGISYTFIKAMGGSIGDSLFEEDFIKTAEEIIEEANRCGVKLILPIDCIIANKFDNNADIKISKITQIPDGWQSLDIGIKTAELFTKIIENSKTILWNGPVGVFEMEHFCNGTIKIALAVSRATAKGAYSVVGGGDSIAALNKYNLADSISFISTAGGALLEYIENGDLPSIKAIRTNI